MESKAKQYIQNIGESIMNMPVQYRENFEVMQDFADILEIAEPGSDDYQEAKAEWEDYDEQILKALKRDYPKSTPASATGGTMRWNWVKEGEELRVDWSDDNLKNDGRYYLTRQGEENIILVEKVGVGFLGNSDPRRGELITRIPEDMELEKSSIKDLDRQEALAGSMPPLDEKGLRRIDSEALDALEAHLEKLPQTKDMHSEYGEYTDERNQLHAEIIKEEVEGNTCIRREAPIVILTGGLPGSGKSTYIRNNKDWMDHPAIFKIDADDIRAKLPEYQGWNASQTHSETQDIVKTLLGKVGKFGCSYDVIYDGTMNKSKKYKPLVEVLKKEGYRIFIMFLKVDKNTSLERAMGRYQKSGRYVPRFVIEEGVQNGMTAFEELKGMVDGYLLIDGKTQKVLEKGGAEIPNDRDYSKLDDQPAQNVSKVKPRKKAQKVYKKDYYAAMDKAHPGLSQAQVKGMNQKDYEALMDKLEQGGKGMGLTSKKASQYAEAYVSVHLPKGSGTKKSKGYAPPSSMEVFMVMDQPEEPGQYDLDDANLYLSEEKALVNKDEGVAVRVSLDITQWMEDNELSFKSEKDLLKELQEPGWSWDGLISIEEEISAQEYTAPESLKAYGVLGFVDKEEDYYEYDTLSIEFKKERAVKVAKEIGEWAVELDFKARKWLDRLKKEGGPIPMLQSLDDVKTEIRGGGYEYDEDIVSIGKVLHNPDDLSNLTKGTDNTPSYSWRTPTDTKKLTPILNHCQEYAMELEEDMVVQLKGTGQQSIEVTAKKGEYLIFDDKGHLVFVMNPTSFKRKCIENTTVEDHKKTKHLADQAEAYKKELDKVKAEAKKEAAKAEPSPKPAAKADKPKPAADSKPKKEDKPKVNCTAEELTTAQKIAKLMKMVDENSMVWSDIFDSKQWKKTREIEGIYEMRAEEDKGKIIVKARDWSAKGKKEAEKWYKLCIDSYRLTKMNAPSLGSYRSVVSKSQLQAAYTTKGERKYRKCAAIHSELAKCRMKGNCTMEQRERYKKEVNTCGNLAKTKVGVPKYITYLHSETKKRRKKGEAYHDALARVAEELRKAAA